MNNIKDIYDTFTEEEKHELYEILGTGALNPGIGECELYSLVKEKKNLGKLKGRSNKLKVVKLMIASCTLDPENKMTTEDVVRASKLFN